MSNDNSEWQEHGGGAQSDMWLEEAGKSIQGKLVKVKTGVGKNKSNIYELEVEPGKVVGVWGSTVLDSRFEDIEVGTDVKILYNGKKQGEKARGAYKDYTVFTRTPASAASGVGTEESKDLPF